MKKNKITTESKTLDEWMCNQEPERLAGKIANAKYTEEYFNKIMGLAKSHNYSIETMPDELEGVAAIDLIIEKFSEMGKDTPDGYILFLDMMKMITEEIIENPLNKKDVQYNKYFLKRLDNLKFVHELNYNIREQSNKERKIPSPDLNIHFSLPRLALIHFYRNKYLQRNQCPEILTDLNTEFKTSHDIDTGSFYKSFISITDEYRRFRVHADETKKTFNKKVKNLQIIIPFLSGDAKQKAESELDSLQKSQSFFI